MVNFIFYDNNERLIPNIDPSEHLPNEVASMCVEGPFDSNKSSYKVFTKMLKSSPEKLEKISVADLSQEESPEFLAFLLLLCNKTNSLGLLECPLSTNATTCLMAALIARDGIRSLSMSLHDTSMPENQAKILFEAVASSPCLESFDLAVEFDNSQAVRRYLIQALGRNQNLKHIVLHTYAFAGAGPTFLPNVLKASILGPNVKSVSIMDNRVHDLQLDVLQDLLCRKDCTLEELHLDAVGISIEHGWDGSIIQNKSVTHLSIKDGSLSHENKQLAKIVSLFKSLVELNLYANDITQLAFLDPLLFGETSRLKSLTLTCNDIDEEGMTNFIEKLRTTKGLKLQHFAIKDNGWETSDSVKTALINALRKNTDLEHADFGRQDLPLDLNRGGRRVFESPPPQPFPTNLLPHVLERASKKIYYKPSDRWGHPTNDKAGADVVSWMVQRILLQTGLQPAGIDRPSSKRFRLTQHSSTMTNQVRILMRCHYIRSTRILTHFLSVVKEARIIPGGNAGPRRSVETKQRKRKCSRRSRIPKKKRATNAEQPIGKEEEQEPAETMSSNPIA